MSRNGLLVGLALVVLAFPAFGQVRGQAPAPKGLPTFVEQPIPEGKAIVYIYDVFGLPVGDGWGSTPVLGNTGPIAILGQGRLRLSPCALVS